MFCFVWLISAILYPIKSMFRFVFVQKLDVNEESLKHGEMKSYVVYVYDIHFPRHSP